MELSELFQATPEATRAFFQRNLEEESVGWDVDPLEVIYVASVLASIARTSRYDRQELLCLNLSQVFKHYVMKVGRIADPAKLERAGGYSLFLAGFFREQMSRRHNVNWYDQVGASFYERAGFHTENPRKKALLERMSENFPNWTQICSNLNKNFQQNQDRKFLISLS